MNCTILKGVKEEKRKICSSNGGSSINLLMFKASKL